MPSPARIFALFLLALIFLAAAGTGLWFLAQGLTLALTNWWGSPLWAALATGFLFSAPLLILALTLLSKGKKRESPKDLLVAAALKEAVKHPVAAAAVTLGLGYLAGRSPLAESLITRILKESEKR